MSELKSVYIDRAGDWCRSGNDTGEFYLKSEADKLIAGLEDKLRAANEQIENLINSASSIMLFQDRVKDNKCAELRHQKYKRCLAMARWCKMSARENDTRMCLPMKCTLTRHEEYLYFIGYYHKWHRRWLELAKKFKEADK